MPRPHPSRRNALQGLGGLALAAAMPLSRAWAEAGGPSLNFLAVGDWGREGRFHQREVAIRMGESAKELDARFVISVGDNFYPSGVTGIGDAHWQNSFEQVYAAPSLQVPWHVALGNHDYMGNAQAQIDYSATSKRWRLPARWYSFDASTPDDAGIEFFVVDTSPMLDFYYDHADGGNVVKVADQKHNVPVQLAWLDQKLAASRADWKIVIGHHPIYSGRIAPGVIANGPDRFERRAGGQPDLQRRLDPILKRHRVPLYFNGHDHDLQHIKRGGTHYVCTGAGSKMTYHCDMGGSDFCSLHSGFVACSINAARIRIAYRDYKGAILHVVDIPRPA